LNGTVTDGTKFDWSKYRGKVVLVEFWTTSCFGCREELPNVKANYDTYHAQGFEVVGVALDDELAAVDAYLAETGVPWKTLYDGSFQTNPLATYYGIMGVPTILLVDKQGKVVSTDVRGPELSKAIERLLEAAKSDAPENKLD